MMITKADTHKHTKETKMQTNRYKNPSHPRSPESGEIGARGRHKYDLEDQLAGHIQTAIAFKKPPSTGRQKNDDTFEAAAYTYTHTNHKNNDQSNNNNEQNDHNDDSNDDNSKNNNSTNNLWGHAKKETFN